MAAFSAELANLVVCPACRQALAAIREGATLASLQCSGCGNRYPVIDGIPILLVESAIQKTPAS